MLRGCKAAPCAKATFVPQLLLRSGCWEPTWQHQVCAAPLLAPAPRADPLTEPARPSFAGPNMVRLLLLCSFFKARARWWQEGGHTHGCGLEEGGLGLGLRRHKPLRARRAAPRDATPGARGRRQRAPQRSPQHTWTRRNPTLFPLAGGYWLRLSAVPQRESVPDRQPSDRQRRRPHAPVAVRHAGKPHRRNSVLGHGSVHQWNSPWHGRGLRQEVQRLTSRAPHPLTHAQRAQTPPHSHRLLSPRPRPHSRTHTHTHPPLPSPSSGRKGSPGGLCRTNQTDNCRSKSCA